ncbi:MAG: hypothetical protein QMC90_03220 [Dehalococcoidales bacterium]|nr:hypothetical protein [Dehalococcoidales bacterium]
MPDITQTRDRLESIPGMVPSLIDLLVAVCFIPDVVRQKLSIERSSHLPPNSHFKR